MADNPIAKPWYQTDPNTGGMTAYNWGGTPTASSWTSGGLTTTGILNPFGLKTNSSGAVIDPYQNPQYYNAAQYSQPGATTNGSYWSDATGGWVTPTNNTTTPQTSSPTQTAPQDNQQSTTPSIDPSLYTTGGGILANPASFATSNGVTTIPSYTPPITSNVSNNAPQATSPTQNTTSNVTGSTAINPSSFIPTWQNGVSITSPDPNNLGQNITQGGNPAQFASNQTAQQLAQTLGGRVTQSQLAWPGGTYSTPQNMITGPNGISLNAGLASGLLNNYGSGAGSYGNYLLARDASGNQAAFPSYDQWASQQPGYNPGARGPEARDTPQFLQNPTAPQYAQTPLQAAQNIPQQSAQNVPDFLSQIGSILQLLQAFGLVNSIRQRPPALTPQSNLLSNFYSRFA